MVSLPPPSTILEEVTDPVELAAAGAQREQFDRNWRWFQDHAAAIFRDYRGKHLCIAGEELFAADMTDEAVERARQAHPDDAGWFVWYVPLKKMPRIYANRW
ncbi:MAG TPA: hypothetical protein VML55_25655 [Planctomycetaceae bacterium]|nr:hypothetical protein [Planctomycetaceae bacterium]